MEKEDFKRHLATLLFETTTTEELPLNRIFEIADAITDDVLELAKKWFDGE